MCALSYRTHRTLFVSIADECSPAHVCSETAHLRNLVVMLGARPLLQPTLSLSSSSRHVTIKPVSCS